MHLRRAKTSEHHSHFKKFLDNSRDPVRRLKSLRSGLDKSSVLECKEIIGEYASAVFHVFYASFTAMEQTIHERVQKGRSTTEQVRELLEVILPSLEKLIVYSPERIHKRWQYNSTCLVIRKLLHPENIIELRQYGIKLVVLWLQTLQESAGDAALELFASAIPHFPPKMTPDGLATSPPTASSSSTSPSTLCERYGVYSCALTDGKVGPGLPELPPSSSCFPADYNTIPGKQDWVSTSVIYPLCASSSATTDPTIQLMEYLLSCLTSQVGKLRWTDPADHMKGFSFLFYQFKLFYLACLYQNFRSDAGLYAPIPAPGIEPLTAEEEADSGAASMLSVSLGEDNNRTALSVHSKESYKDHSSSSTSSNGNKQQRLKHSMTVSAVIKLHYDTTDPIYNAIRQLILKFVLRWIMPGYHSNRPGAVQQRLTTPSPSMLAPLEESFVPKGSDLMRDTWFTSRDNVNLLFEIFHKGFQLSLSHPGIVNKLTELYVSWALENDKPLFMQQPTAETTKANVNRDLLPPTFVMGGERHGVAADSAVSPASSLSVVPWEIIKGYSKFDRSSISAGMQPSLRMFVAHSSQLFLHKAKDKTTLDNQVESCNRIIRLYQSIAQHWLLDKEGWEYLLAVLLFLTRELLKDEPPTDRDASLGGRLADSLLHTLFVCFVRASMVAEVSNRLWDQLVAVTSSLTKWEEVIYQWKVVMRSMTQCLARVVYQLDLDRLPLDQMEKETGPFRIRTHTSSSAEHFEVHRKPSFSDFRPRGPSKTMPRTRHISQHSLMPSTARSGLSKASTVEEASSAYSSPLGFVRRVSTPATISGSAPSSVSASLPLRRKILSSKHEEMLEEKHIDEEVESGIVEPGTIQTGDFSAVGSDFEQSLLEGIIVTEEGEKEGDVDRTNKSSRNPQTKRSGYHKLPILSEPPAEAVIANPHVVGSEDGNSTFPSSQRSRATTEGTISTKGEVTNLERMISDEVSSGFKLINMTSSPRAGRRLNSSPRAGRRLKRGNTIGGGDLVISNTVIEDAEQQAGEGPSEEGREGVDMSATICVAPSAVKPSNSFQPMRRSRSEDASFYRRVKVLDNADDVPVLLTSSNSSAASAPEPANNSPSFSDIIGRRETGFSEFVPEARVSSPLRTSSPHTPQTFDLQSPSPLPHPPSLASCGKQSSSVHEENSGGEHVRTAGCPTPTDLPVSASSHSSSPIQSAPSSSSSSSNLPMEGCWTVVSASVVWQRMLRVLGDVNKIQWPAIHGMAMTCVRDIWKRLEEIEANSGVSLDNFTSPTVPEYMPPMMLLFPWVVKACSLPLDFFEGRKVAYQLLCEMVLRRSSSSPSISLLPYFYHLVHLGLQPTADVLNVVVKASCRLFSFGLPGSTVLLHDCLSVCTYILGTRSTDVPRVDALTLLGSMQYLLVQHSDTSLPVPSTGTLLSGSQLRDKLTKTLFEAARREPLRHSRCLALHQIGMLVYSELRSKSPSQSVLEGINILLASLRFSDIPVAMVAVDMLTLLVEVAGLIEKHFPSSPAILLQALSSAIASSLLITEEKMLKVSISLMFCLRDWLMALPVQQLVKDGSISQAVFTETFEVLHYAASVGDVYLHSSFPSPPVPSFPVDVKLLPLEPTKTRSSSSTSSFFVSTSRRGEVLADSKLEGGGGEKWEEQIRTTARSVLSHLINLLGHFPFSCGAAQMSSIVCEYHDCPSLQYLDELSSEIFFSPRVQFFALNHSAIITLVEIPTTNQVDGVSMATYETRVIVRDVTGKHSWDCAILYGPKPAPTSATDSYSPVLVSAPSSESISSAAADSEYLSAEHPGGGGGVRSSNDPPTWRSHTTDDILSDLLGHLEHTSPECVLHPGVVGLAAPIPAVNQFTDAAESGLLAAVDQLQCAETQYYCDTFSIPCMESIPMKPPDHVHSMFAFHHCRIFLSHLGLLSWNRRNYLDVLEKNEQLIRELKHLDGTQTQCRQTYKVAVLYVARGQENKHSILCNNKGSEGFEDFVAGLGWEVDMETHAGYMGGLQRTFCKDCTLPYYSTSSEEILFHVSTRMPSKGTDIEQKVRHLGNDEIHIVWSEHWRDYRRTIFKTHFADILIIIYPLPNNLFRVQINRKDPKTNVSFGPLFDGALIDKTSLPSLVRATAINGFRALRSPLVSYRGRYQERYKNIQDVMKMRVKCCYEEFAQSVIHPIEFGQPNSATTNVRYSPVKQLTTTNMSQAGVPSTLASAQSVSSLKYAASPETRWSMSPRVSSLLRLARTSSKNHTDKRIRKAMESDELLRRPRSRTVEESTSPSQQPSRVSISHRHGSVPDNLPSLGIPERAPSSPHLSVVTSPVAPTSRSHSLSTVVNSSIQQDAGGFHRPSKQS